MTEEDPNSSQEEKANFNQSFKNSAATLFLEKESKLKIEEKLSKTIYSNADLNQFKEDILQLIREKDMGLSKKIYV